MTRLIHSFFLFKKYTMKYYLTFVLFFLLSFQLNAQILTTDEEKLISFINQQIPQNLKLLKELVNINSGTLNTVGVRKVGEILKHEFDKIEFSTNWITFPDSLKRAGHLVAYRKGKKGKKLFLIGHLDTVFELDTPANPYTILNDSTVTGQGVLDMKGGDVIILAALQAINHFGWLKEATITAYFTGDEEKPGQPSDITRADFIERAKSHDIALAFEGGPLNKAVIGRRGFSSWKLNVYGNQAHSSVIFSKSAGYGSIYESARILDSFRVSLSNEKFLTFNPGLIAGGTTLKETQEDIKVSGKNNIIASKTIVTGDLRFLTEKQMETAKVKMEKIVTINNLPGSKAEITFNDLTPSMEPTEGNQKLLDLFNKVSLDMKIGEIEAFDPGQRGAGDISFVAKYLDCLDGIGANGSGAHAPGETMNLKDFTLSIQRAAIFIYRLINE